MCGIAGGMGKGGRPPNPDILGKFTDALQHRGPDGDGQHVADHVGLVHTRLAIIDLEHGNQPFVSSEGVTLVANGEIYNDLELRHDLADSAFQTGSDNESILHLYLKHGFEFAEKLSGMYAAALYDPRSKSLVLARDPFGIKPLYIAETDDGFWFASEPQALIAAGVVVAEENELARDQLLALQYTCGSETAFRNIKRVGPGETLIVRDGRIVNRLRVNPLQKPERVDGNSLSTFDGLWMNAVDRHRRSDTPYGLFLSGGVDSAAVLAAMVKLEDRPVVAYTAGFAGGDFHDERDHARVVAKAAGADHRAIEITAADFWSDLPAMVACMDDPVADYAIVPTYALAKVAKEDVKVVLTGEGGDEIFAGYGRYRAGRRPWPFRKKPWSRNSLGKANVLRRESETWREDINQSEREFKGNNWSNLQALQALDIAYWLPDDLLTKVDRCLMAHGLEGRVPFLDRDLAAFGFNCTDDDKIKGRLGKQVVRHWLANEMPEAQPYSKKRGFSVPVGHWIGQRGKALAPLVSKQAGVAAACDPEAVSSLFSNITAETAFPAWQLLFYALWHQVHVSGLPRNGSVFEVLSQR
jgi:asparagine synthase (glutamine-hydrolysing)